MEELTPMGSQWYFCGDHYTVIGHEESDGEPGVRIRMERGRKPRCTVIERLFLRKAIRTED